MSVVALVTSAPSADRVLPSLSLLAHSVHLHPPDVAALLAAAPAELVLIDATGDLAAAKALCRLLCATGGPAPLIGVLTEGGLAAVSVDWGLDDVVLATVGPAELDMRLRLALARAGAAGAGEDSVIRRGELVIDETTYQAKVKGRPLDLTFKEFELLKHLALHPGRVFTREALLRDVWGYDYYGGTRTVDVHVRRLRAKLGPEHEALIATVRHVGYKLESSGGRPLLAEDPTPEPVHPR